MKYLMANILSCSEGKNEKGFFKADLQLSTKRKLQSGEIISVEEILTVSSVIKLSVGIQLLRVKTEYHIDNKVYYTVDESTQNLTVKKQP